jgi:hypothetical protein
VVAVSFLTLSVLTTIHLTTSTTWNMTAKSTYSHLGSIIGPHRGAIDQTTTTTQQPPEVMKRVREALESMGVEIQVECEYRYRCIRARRPPNLELVPGSLSITKVVSLPSAPVHVFLPGNPTPRAILSNSMVQKHLGMTLHQKEVPVHYPR